MKETKAKRKAEKAAMEAARKQEVEGMMKVYCTRSSTACIYLVTLCCTVLYCAVLYCTVLCCTVLYCTVVYCVRCVMRIAFTCVLAVSRRCLRYTYFTLPPEPM